MKDIHVISILLYNYWVRNRLNKITIENLKMDRKQGLSIPELMIKYSLPKTTIWHHVHKIVMSEDMVRKIMSTKGGSHKRRLERERLAYDHALSLLNSEQNQRLILATSMLYWAEGHKKTLVFTNTDSNMILIYLKFLYGVLGVEKSKVSLLIRIPSSVSQQDIIDYWSKTVPVLPSMIKCNIDEKNNKTKKTNGICRVIVAKSGYYHRVVLNLIEILNKELNQTPL